MSKKKSTPDKEQKRLKKMVIDLYRQNTYLRENDLKKWRQACQLARNIENPYRVELYNIYRDVELDLHLAGAVGQVNGFIKCRSFKLVDENGDTDTDAVKYLNTEWFKELMDLCLESIYWGHSLIELGDVITDANGRISYNGVKLIPREHVIPEHGRIVKHTSDSWHSGLPYREAPNCYWLIEAGKKNDLGKYEKAALQTIPKKYAMSFWDAYAEMFGIPLRIAKTSTRDNTERNRVAKMMETMGAKAWGVFDDTTEIELVESSKGDAYNVYDKRIERCNTELSKLVLQQTMSIDNGSSHSQSETHLKVFKNLIESYSDFLRDIFNNQLLPNMVRHGFPLKGYSFEWDDPVDYTPEQQLAYEKFIAINYEVPGSYFEDKYGVPAGERRNPQYLQQEQDNEQKRQENSSPFFA